MENNVESISSNHLKQIVEKIERIEEDKTNIMEDIRNVYAEAKASGFDSKIIRQIIKLRKMAKADREEQEELLELYKSAIGML
ncbi:hypothetical protein NOVO_02735 [Rickettsiales bacterium Ac37b]|nr:hypothetical protein NOVO_02735 [Rickettsiales bacterium Ac37b]